MTLEQSHTWNTIAEEIAAAVAKGTMLSESVRAESAEVRLTFDCSRFLLGED